MNGIRLYRLVALKHVLFSILLSTRTHIVVFFYYIQCPLPTISRQIQTFQNLFFPHKCLSILCTIRRHFREIFLFFFFSLVKSFERTSHGLNVKIGRGSFCECLRSITTTADTFIFKWNPVNPISRLTVLSN